MKITIISIGSKVPDWINSACIDYLKRFNQPYQILMKELKSERRNPNQSIASVLALEENKIRTAIPEQAHIIVLDEEGKSHSSVSFSQLFSKWEMENLHPCFIIGSADGISPQLKKDSHAVIKLSSMTFPHHFAKIILIEQIYRSITILLGHPYHRV